MLSLGGWSGCSTCSQIFASDEGRKEFAAPIKELSSRFHTDGIDIYWEFPAAPGFPGPCWMPEDRKNLKALIKALREKLGTEKEVSIIAVCFSPYLRQSIDWKNAMAYLDGVNLKHSFKTFTKLKPAPSFSFSKASGS